MKTTAFALLATVLMAAPAFAQDAGGAAGGAAAGGKGGKAKEMVENCRNEAKSQGLKGADMKKAVMDCVSKQNPKIAARLQCRLDGKAKGLDGDQLKSYIKDCAKGGKS